MSPSRRTILRTCGVALSAAVGGCLSSPGGESTTDPGATAESPATGDATSTAAPPEVREVDGVDRGVPSALLGTREADPFRSFAVGSCECGPNARDDGPHGLWVWNDTDGALAVELALTADGETILDDQYEFDAGATRAIELREPRAYELTVRTGDREEVATVERDRFDCNDSATDVAVRDAEIESGWITTELSCGTTTA